MRGQPGVQKGEAAGKSKLAGGESVRLRTGLRHWLGPFTIPTAARQLQNLVREVQPDLVHAMRIPYEGMVAAQAMEDFPETPLLVSVWGNDFTLHAQATPWMSRYTQRTLGRADALHTDCQRDLHLAPARIPNNRPAMVLPGSGGPPGSILSSSSYPSRTNVIINPLSFRAYVRNDIFSSRYRWYRVRSRVKFYCPAMQDQHKRIAGYGNMEFRRMLSCYPG
jgi:hypothetical protein